MPHTFYDHITPEIERQLADPSDANIEAKIAKVISHTEENTEDPETVYAAGIGWYFLGEYEKCMLAEEQCYPLFDDEMGIAAIFWHTLAAWRAGKRPSLLEENYRHGMLVGHHKSYNRIMAIAIGSVSEESAFLMYKHMISPLDKTIYGYGFSCWLSHIGKKDDALRILREIASDRSFWIAYAYLAAYLDENRKV